MAPQGGSRSKTARERASLTSSELEAGGEHLEREGSQSAKCWRVPVEDVHDGALAGHGDPRCGCGDASGCCCGDASGAATAWSVWK